MYKIILGLLFSFPLFGQTFHVWSEFQAYTEVKSQLPFLKKHNVILHLAINQNDFNNQEKFEQFSDVLREAKIQKVGVYLWPLLPEENGYWPNSSNIDLFLNYLDHLIDKLETQKLKFDGVSFDLEPAPEFTRNMLSYLKHFQINKLIGYLNQFCDNTGANAHFQLRLSDYVSKLNSAFIKTHLVTTSYVLDDLNKGQDKIQLTFGIPLIYNALEYSFMVYSTDFKNFLGKISSYPVYEYGVIAKKYFPTKKLALDLGLIGEVNFPSSTHGYKKSEQIKDDIRASLAAGINRVNYYSLEGLIATKRPDSWFMKVKGKVPHKSLKWILYKKVLDKIYSRICK